MKTESLKIILLAIIALATITIAIVQVSGWMNAPTLEEIHQRFQGPSTGVIHPSGKVRCLDAIGGKEIPCS